MPPLRVLAALPLLGLAACDAERPSAAAATAYVSAMQPVVSANAALGDQFVDLTAAIQANQLDTSALATRFDAEILPGSRAVVDSAMAVPLGAPEVTAAHMDLVGAWTRRANAFHDLSRAWHNQDLGGFDAARGDILSATEAEGRAFAAINAGLAPSGAKLSPYPTMKP